ncbi:MAG: hypothetical protein K1000chlam3_00179 [Chlamydiae bacterium]|nr:hypothetical protein [Chlamydiota bacterium]
MYTNLISKSLFNLKPMAYELHVQILSIEKK